MTAEQSAISPEHGNPVAAPTNLLPTRSDPPVALTEVIGICALALLVCSGQLKTGPLVRWLPVDLTLLTLVVVIACCLVRVLKGTVRMSGLWAPVLLLVALAVSITYAPHSSYAESKSTVLLTITSVLMIAPFALGGSSSARAMFVTFLLAVSGFVAITLWFDPTRATTYSDIVVFGESNTIGTARVIGAGALIAAIRALAPRSPARLRIAYSLTTVFLVLSVIRTGARGPLLAILVGVLLVVLGARMLRGIHGRTFLVVSASFLVAVFWVLSAYRGDGTQRIIGLISGDADASALARTHLFSLSIEYIPGFPAGTGLGGFSTLPGIRFSPYMYPHNVVLETAVEAGWIAAALLLIYLLVAFRHSFRGSASVVGSSLLGLLGFAFMNSLISGDINSNRLLWAVASLCIVSAGDLCRDARDINREATRSTRSA